jgi:hypothetical protein
LANPTGKGGWKPGESGNPKGRPPKARALTEILERAGSRTVEYNGKRMAGKRLVAAMLWEMATTGQCELPSGRTLVAGMEEWLDVVKYLYAQIDGPPPKDINLGGTGGGPMVVEVIWNEAGLEDSPADTPLGTGGGSEE